MFWNNARKKDGKNTYCKPCHRELKERYKSKDPEGYQERARNHRDKYRVTNPGRAEESYRKSHLKNSYGISVEQYDEMLARQQGACACCKQQPVDRRLAVDHDHACCPGRRSCGQCIRGLLCDNCNKILGMVKDSLAHLSALAAYLDSQATKI